MGDTLSLSVLKGACAEAAAAGLQGMGFQGEEESARVIGSSGAAVPTLSVHVRDPKCLPVAHTELEFSSCVVVTSLLLKTLIKSCLPCHLPG